jgi:hypothetical protein
LSVTYSPPLRIDCRPSALLQASIVLLGLLALAALWQSALPRVLLAVVPVLVLHALVGLRRQPRGTLLLRDDGSAGWVDGEEEPIELASFEARQRGPLVALSFRLRSRPVRIVLLPDTLPASQRRLLTLRQLRHGANSDAQAAAHV